MLRPPRSLSLFFERLRVLHWLHFLLFPLAGLALSQGGRLPLEPGRALPPLALAACLLGHAYAFNDYHDLDRTPGRPWHLLPLALALPLLLAVPPLGRAAALLFVALAALYSGPLRLKRYPYLCTLFNAVGFPLLCLLGVERLSLPVGYLLGLAATWMAAAQLFHEMAHAPQDASCGIRTTALHLGQRRCVLVALLLLSLSVGMAWGLDRFAGVSMLVYLLAVLLLVVFLDPPARRSWLRRLGLLWALVVGARFLLHVA